MHLALVSETFPPEVNGVALTVQSLALELVALGHRVTVVRPRQGHERLRGIGTRAPLTPSPLPEGERDRLEAESDTVAIPSPREAARGAGVRGLLPSEAHDELLTASLPIPRYPGLRFGLPCASRLKQYWRETQVDAVYVATEGPLGCSALNAARALGLPVASGFHTRFDDYFKHYGAAWLRRLALGWMRRFHNRADCTLVPTESLRQWLVSNRFERVSLLRRAVETRQFHPGQRDAVLRARLGAADGAPIVLAVGRIAAEKNLDLLVAAFERIRAQAPGARLVWVGDGPERAALEQRHPRHVFTGILRGEALAQVYASADLFLFPSLSETFGNVTLEAMASGLAVCAFDYGAAGEHLRDGLNGYLAPFGDTQAYLRACERMSRDWLAGMRLGHAARQAVASLSPRQVAEDLAQLFRDLQAQRKHAMTRSRQHDAAVHSTIL